MGFVCCKYCLSDYCCPKDDECFTELCSMCLCCCCEKFCDCCDKCCHEGCDNIKWKRKEYFGNHTNIQPDFNTYTETHTYNTFQNIPAPT